MRRRKEDEDITPEEKELIRRLMETPGIEKEWDFFKDMSDDIPPPEFFMRGKPDPRFKYLRKFAKAGALVASVLICAMFLSTLMVPETASADRKPFEILVENIKNGFLSIGPGNEGEEPASLETTFNSEKDVKEYARKLMPELLIPSVMLTNYDFNFLKIKNDEQGVYNASFLYKTSEGSELKIQQRVNSNDIDALVANCVVDGKIMEEGEFYTQLDPISETCMLSIWNRENGVITISGIESEDDLKLVFKGLK